MSIATSAPGARTEPEPTSEGAPAGAEAEMVEDELLVEEISIDGMCGVY